MVLGRRYQLTPTARRELQEVGIDNAALEALRARTQGRVFNKKDFRAVLDELGPRKLNDSEKQAVERYTRLSLLRLERVIPNRGVREWIDALVFAVIIAAIVRSFIVAPFKIPSGSMYPTIEVGDHIFATMYSYGVHVPFTDVRLFPQPVERGDIIIFPFPADPSVDYIKRVIAKGGEVVEVRGEKVFIDGKPLDEPYAYYDPSVRAAYERRGQKLPAYGPVKVPEGKLFMMGDNRLNSSDSRVWGFLDADTVKGEGQIIYWSHDPTAGLLSGYHLGRIGMLLR